MFKEERQSEIMAILQKENYATVESLARKLHASASSIRRDVTSLEKKGFLRRSYGGVELLFDSFRSAPSFSVHQTKHVGKKRQIAKVAARLIEDKSVVFLDGSSSCYYLAEEIAGRKNITVITNNIITASLLSQSDVGRVYCTGGIASAENRAVLGGSFAEHTVLGIHADLFFFSTLALSRDGWASDDSEEENRLRRAMLSVSERHILLCDSHKLGHTSVFPFCHVRDIDTVISDVSLDGFFCESYPETNLLSCDSAGESR